MCDYVCASVCVNFPLASSLISSKLSFCLKFRLIVNISGTHTCSSSAVIWIPFDLAGLFFKIILAQFFFFFKGNTETGCHLHMTLFYDLSATLGCRSKLAGKHTHSQCGWKQSWFIGA